MHGTQSSLLVKLPTTYVPGSHDAGMGEAEPYGQKKPPGQTLHALLPSSSWYDPSRQMSHSAMPSLGAALATLHGEGAVAPETQ